MNTSTLIQKVWNFCDTLRTAFAGKVLPQAAKDEPAKVLLAGIRVPRAAVKTLCARKTRAPA